MVSKKKHPAFVRPARWDDTHAAYLTGRAHIDGAAALGAKAEAHWGCGRLRLLVSTELRAKFDSQRSKLQVAIETGQLDDVVREADRMATAWRALDTAAREAGHPPISSTVWEVTLQDGTVAAIVQDYAIAHDVVAGGRQVAVYSLAEIGELLSHYAGVVKAKVIWPGATVTRVSRSVSDPLSDFRAPEAEALAAVEATPSAETMEEEPW
jgi:hypothetical protein